MPSRSRYAMPQALMSVISGMADLPNSVRLYSVFGGTTGYTLLSMSPSASSSRSCLVSILPVASGTRAWISLNLFFPSLRHHRTTDLYFPPRRRTVALTGHSASKRPVSASMTMVSFWIVYVISYRTCFM